MSGRKKLSGSAALSLHGNGWGKELRGSSCPLVSDGPDIVLDPSVDAMGVGSMWDDITRAEASASKETEA